MVEVICPECGERYDATGKREFHHCGKRFKIYKNLAKDDKNDRNNSGGSEKQSEQQETTDNNENGEKQNNNRDRGQNEQLEVEGAREKEDEDSGEDYYCQDCGAEVSEGQTFCSGCGKKLNWSGL